MNQILFFFCDLKGNLASCEPDAGPELWFTTTSAVVPRAAAAQSLWPQQEQAETLPSSSSCCSVHTRGLQAGALLLETSRSSEGAPQTLSGAVQTPLWTLLEGFARGSIFLLVLQSTDRGQAALHEAISIQSWAHGCSGVQRGRSHTSHIADGFFCTGMLLVMNYSGHCPKPCAVSP